MKVELVNVTPQMASEMLRSNTNNRDLRRGMVESLKNAFMRGEYIMTHQGVAFSESGELIDGQHRLTAISELRDGTFPMLVTRGIRDDSFRVLDIGAKRSPADALRIGDKRVVEAARLIATIVQNRTSTVTPTMLLPIIEAIEPLHSELISFCPSMAKTWSSAAVRLAAICSMSTGSSKDYVKTTYSAFIRQDFDLMSPVAVSLFKSHLNGAVRASATTDMFARCLVCFNDKKSSLQKIQIKDSSESLAVVKALFGHLISKEREEKQSKLLINKPEFGKFKRVA